MATSNRSDATAYVNTFRAVKTKAADLKGKARNEMLSDRILQILDDGSEIALAAIVDVAASTK